MLLLLRKQCGSLVSMRCLVRLLVISGAKSNLLVLESCKLQPLPSHLAVTFDQLGLGDCWTSFICYGSTIVTSGCCLTIRRVWSHDQRYFHIVVILVNNTQVINKLAL